MIKNITLSIILFCILPFYIKAAPYFHITRIQAMPDTVKLGHTALGIYAIKNVSGINLDIYMRYLPSFVTIQQGLGACINGGSLKNNETCQAKLVFHADNINNSFNDQNDFYICPSTQSIIGCVSIVNPHTTTVVN